MNQEERQKHMIECMQALNPEEVITKETKIKGTTIEKLCEFNAGGYNRVIGWMENQLKGGYQTKDSGERRKYDSGYQRDTAKGKPRYDLIPHECLKRLAELFARGAEKYGDDNWKKACTEEEFQSFVASAYRHFEAWRHREEDEDHAMGAVINIFFYEWVTKYKDD